MNPWTALIDPASVKPKAKTRGRVHAIGDEAPPEKRARSWPSKVRIEAKREFIDPSAPPAPPALKAAKWSAQASLSPVTAASISAPAPRKPDGAGPIDAKDVLTLPASSMDPHRGPFERTAGVLRAAGENFTAAVKPERKD